VWNWPDESGHIWEAQSPHLLYANKGLKINTLDKEVLQGSIKLAFAKPLQIKGSRRKMGSYKFPNVSTVMWPSPVWSGLVLARNDRYPEARYEHISHVYDEELIETACRGGDAIALLRLQVN
jgi:hypothetical protein